MALPQALQSVCFGFERASEGNSSPEASDVEEDRGLYHAFRPLPIGSHCSPADSLGSAKFSLKPGILSFEPAKLFPWAESAVYGRQEAASNKGQIFMAKVKRPEARGKGWAVVGQRALTKPCSKLV
ncbi:MAG: hypothetical protein FRX49_08380 [Trebouxia sp. A1-2]|nr:MAG: hypothetical protein FRX49_08380 [Trebouxia sp. A1-2]